MRGDLGSPSCLCRCGGAADGLSEATSRQGLTLGDEGSISGRQSHQKEPKEGGGRRGLRNAATL